MESALWSSTTLRIWVIVPCRHRSEFDYRWKLRGPSTSPRHTMKSCDLSPSSVLASCGVVKVTGSFIRTNNCFLSVWSIRHGCDHFPQINSITGLVLSSIPYPNFVVQRATLEETVINRVELNTSDCRRTQKTLNY